MWLIGIHLTPVRLLAHENDFPDGTFKTSRTRSIMDDFKYRQVSGVSGRLNHLSHTMYTTREIRSNHQTARSNMSTTVISSNTLVRNTKSLYVAFKRYRSVGILCLPIWLKRNSVRLLQLRSYWGNMPKRPSTRIVRPA